jgi:hypothetical protein
MFPVHSCDHLRLGVPLISDRECTFRGAVFLQNLARLGCDGGECQTEPKATLLVEASVASLVLLVLFAMVGHYWP